MKDKCEQIRNEKLNRLSYCSLKCAGKEHTSHLKSYLFKKGNISKSQLDEYSPFRETLRRIKQRDKSFDLTLQDLKEQWEKQKGICPYTKLQLILPTQNKNIKKNHFCQASLDRIDSSKGYIKDNIEFISLPINYMKNTMSKEDTIEFCKIIQKNLKD